MKRTLAILVPLVIAGCQEKTASVAPPPVPPLSSTVGAASTAPTPTAESEPSVPRGGKTASAPLSEDFGRGAGDSEAASYFPFAEGNTWIFEGEIQTKAADGTTRAGTAELIFRLSNVKHMGNKTQALLTVSQGELIVDRSVWQEGPDGIYQLSSTSKNVFFDKPEPILRFPIKGQQIMTWSNSGSMPDGHHGFQNGRTVVSKAPQIDTANGTVQGVESAMSQTFKSDAGSGSATTSTWFQPGVGIVRFVQTLTQKDSYQKSILRLKSWTLQH